MAAHADSVYDTPFYRHLRALITWTVARRGTVIVATLAVFAASLVAFRFLPQQFFPSSSRPELIVDLRLPEGSSFAATLSETKRMESILDHEPGVETYVAYVGAGSPRFYLPLDQQLQQSNFAQLVLVTKSNADRERVRTRLIRLFDEDFPALRGRISRLENGPPVGFPVQFRVSGEDLAKVRAIAQRVMTVVRGEPDVTNAQFDSDEPTKVIRLVVDQNKARVLGLSSQDLAAFLNNSVTGLSVTYLRERDKQIEVLAAWRGGRARATVVPQGPRDSVAQRQGGADHPGRRHPLRAGGRNRLAPRPRADGHGARRRPGECAGPGRREPDQSAAGRDPRGAARRATGSSWAARSRIRHGARSRSPPVCP